MKIREQTAIIDKVELDIKRIILKDVQNGAPFFITNNRVIECITKGLKGIGNKKLQAMCTEQLKIFASKVYIENIRLFNKRDLFLSVVAIANKLGMNVSESSKARLINESNFFEWGKGANRATANQTYPFEYEKEISARVNEIANMTAKTDYSDKYSLRASVERELRQEWQEKQIADYKQSGVNLVWIDTHENCSERCQPYQGKLYSLDHTSGFIDGITFRPLEEATDIYETTKAGKTYKNGCLSGFNCRHKIIPYESGGVKPVPIKAEVINKQRELESKQRYMERTIRKYESKALIFKDLSQKALYRRNKELAKKWTEDYISFSKENKIPFYRSRLT